MSKVTKVIIIISLYVACQMIADIAATKIVQIGTLIMPAGTFVFALTFTLRDIIHKQLGKQWARSAIIAALVANVLMSGYLALATLLPSPDFFVLSDAWNAIFLLVPAITIASIVAEFVSEMLDTEVYHAVKTRLPKAPQWSRVLLSNGIALPIDSLIFALLAFVVLPPLFGAESLPIGVALSIVWGQTIFKLLVTIISMPLIYTTKEHKAEYVIEMRDV